MTDQFFCSRSLRQHRDKTEQYRTGQRQKETRNYKVAIPCCIQSSYFMTGPDAFQYSDSFPYPDTFPYPVAFLYSNTFPYSDPFLYPDRTRDRTETKRNRNHEIPLPRCALSSYFMTELDT